MAIVVDFIREYAVWAYGGCALVAVWYLRVVLQARRDRRYAVFTMEREAALNRVYSAWAVTFGVLVVMGLVYLLSTVVYEAVEPLVVSSGQSTPVMAAPQGSPTMTPTLPVPEIQPSATPTQRPRPTLRPQPTIVSEPPTPAVQAPRCADPRAAITSPGNGSVVSGMVTITGTAAHARFQYYKLEYGAGTEPTVWSYFDGGDKPVENGRLGDLNAGALPPGVYSVRVIVVDVTGNFPPPCQTTIVIP